MPIGRNPICSYVNVDGYSYIILLASYDLFTKVLSYRVVHNYSSFDFLRSLVLYVDSEATLSRQNFAGFPMGQSDVAETNARS